jgi:hypothetical protein
MMGCSWYVIGAVSKDKKAVLNRDRPLSLRKSRREIEVIGEI